MTPRSRPARVDLACCWSSAGNDGARPAAAICCLTSAVEVTLALKDPSLVPSGTNQPRAIHAVRPNTIASTTTPVPKSP